MANVIRATFDGTSFQPKEPVHLPPNTDVTVNLPESQEVETVVLEVDPKAPGEQRNVFEEMLAMEKIADLPADFSENHDYYLYGEGRKTLFGEEPGT